MEVRPEASGLPASSGRPSPGIVRCDKCRAAADAYLLNQPAPLACSGCGSALQVRVFPALFRAPVAPRGPDALLSEEEASCFFHPRKRAVVHCATCGRFLCGLCDLEIDGRHVCPSCIGAGRAKEGGVVGELENTHFLYDQMALMLAFWPMVLMWPVTLFTAPAALYLAIRHWRDPARSLIPRTHSRLIFALTLASLQMLAWAVVLCVSYGRRFL